MIDNDSRHRYHSPCLLILSSHRQLAGRPSNGSILPCRQATPSGSTRSRGARQPARSGNRSCCPVASAGVSRREQRRLLTVSLFGAPNWIAEGPAPITDGGTYGPGGANVIGPTAAESLKAGAVSAIAVDPTNAKHLFAATVNGGIWQTQDFTAANPTWTTTTDLMPSLAIESIAFSPVSSNIIYAGTGSYSAIFLVQGGTSINIGGQGGSRGRRVQVER